MTSQGLDFADGFGASKSCLEPPSKTQNELSEVFGVPTSEGKPSFSQGCDRGFRNTTAPSHPGHTNFVHELLEASEIEITTRNEQATETLLSHVAYPTEIVEILDSSEDDLDMEAAKQERLTAQAPSRPEGLAGFICELEEAAKVEDVAQNEQAIDKSLSNGAVDLTEVVEILDSSDDDFDMEVTAVEKDDYTDICRDDECANLEVVMQDLNDLFEEDNSHLATMTQMRPKSPLLGAGFSLVDYPDSE